MSLAVRLKVAITHSSTLRLFRMVLLAHSGNDSYLISNGIIYLTIAEKSYPRKLAFLYLDELAREFWNSYGPKVETVRKPYAFVGFGTY